MVQTLNTLIQLEKYNMIKAVLNLVWHQHLHQLAVIFQLHLELRKQLSSKTNTNALWQPVLKLSLKMAEVKETLLLKNVVLTVNS